MEFKINTVQGFLNHVYRFYKSQKNFEINILYEGKITHQITKAFISLTEADLEDKEEPDEVRRKIFHVMVESLQNITKHAGPDGETGETEKGRGIFVVSKEENCYRVITGSITSAENADKLSKMLQKINALDAAGLKEMYKQQIRGGGKLSEKGGAGLGFIDIARKTENPLDFSIQEIGEDGNVFFIIAIKINNNK